MASKLEQRFRISAQVIVIISQINLRSKHAGQQSTTQRTLAYAGVEHRRFAPGIRADDHDGIRRFNALDAAVENVGCAAFGGIKPTPALHVGVLRSQSVQQGLVSEEVFDTRQSTANRSDAGRIRGFHARRNSRESLRPGGRAQAAILADVRPIKTLGLQPIHDMAGLVGNPFLVDRFVDAGQDAQHLLAARIDADVAAHGIHHIDGFGFSQFPGPRAVLIRLGGQRPHRTQINNVALQFRAHRRFEIGRDFHILAAPDGTQIAHTGHFLGEAHTARAMDAARHGGFHQGADALVFDSPLVLAVAGMIATVSHGLILQIAFAALVADRAIQRMVDQQEFHDALAGLFHHG